MWLVVIYTMEIPGGSREWLSHVCDITANILSGWEMENTRNSCPLLVEKGNESCHLVF